MKPGDMVVTRESPQTPGIILKLEGRQVVVRWVASTTSRVSRYELKPYQQKGKR